MPIIIWGSRGVTKTTRSGRFHCPQCNRERGYNHKNVRRFFTLFFIPLIPLDNLGEYVECQICRTSFNPRVLSFNPKAQQKKFEAEFHIAVKRVLVLMALADGVVDDKEIEMVQSIYTKVTNVEISLDEVNAEIEVARNDKRGVNQFLSKMAGTLNPSGKELVLQAAFFIAAADGEFQEEEIALLESIGKSLDMSPAHINGVLQQITAHNLPAEEAPVE